MKPANQSLLLLAAIAVEAAEPPKTMATEIFTLSVLLKIPWYK